MKAKLVRYPFDKKKYRWDYKKMGKTFEYKWDESLPKNFDTIEPYIEVEDYDPETHIGYVAIDTGRAPGEYITVDIDPETYTGNEGYAMSYVPEDMIEVDEDETLTARIQLTNRERAYSGLPEKKEAYSKFYYRLTYTTEIVNGKTNVLPKVDFYKDDIALHLNGLTTDDVGVFKTNWNLQYIAGPTLEVYNTGSNNNYQPWRGPFDEPNPDIFKYSTYSYHDGLEWVDGDGKYWYCIGSLTDRMSSYRASSQHANNLEATSVSYLENEVPDNTYEYSYGEGKDGIVKEFDKTTYVVGGSSTWNVYPIIRCWCSYSPDPYDSTFNGLDILPPDYDNGHFTGIYENGRKLPFVPNNDFSIPLTKVGGTYFYWGPSALRYIASLIVSYTFNLPAKFFRNNYTGHYPMDWSTYITRYPEVPQDSDIYESLCHFRTPQTEALGVLLGSYIGASSLNTWDYGKYTSIKWITPLYKEYLYKDRYFEYQCKLSDNNVPGRDWFIPDFTVDKKLEHDWVSPDDSENPDNFPLVDNDMGWFRYWIIYGEPSPMNWASASNATLKAHSTKRIMPRFKTRTYKVGEIEEATCAKRITKEQYDNRYPLSYIGITDNQLDMDILVSNNQQITKNLNISYYESKPYSTTYYYLRLKNAGGYYEYSDSYDKYDRNDGPGSYFDSWVVGYAAYYSTIIKRYNEGSQDFYVSYLQPIISVGQEIELVNYVGEETPIYMRKHGANVVLPNHKFPAGWAQVSVNNRDEISDYMMMNCVKNENIIYDYENIYLVNANQVDNGIFNYIYVEPSSGKYITTPKYALQPNLILLGDQEDDVVEVPDGNTEILNYEIGRVVNDEFVSKPLLTNAVCEYYAEIPKYAPTYEVSSYRRTISIGASIYYGDTTDWDMNNDKPRGMEGQPIPSGSNYYYTQAEITQQSDNPGWAKSGFFPRWMEFLYIKTYTPWGHFKEEGTDTECFNDINISTPSWSDYWDGTNYSPYKLERRTENGTYYTDVVICSGWWIYGNPIHPSLWWKWQGQATFTCKSHEAYNGFKYLINHNSQVWEQTTDQQWKNGGLNKTDEGYTTWDRTNNYYNEILKYQLRNYNTGNETTFNYSDMGEITMINDTYFVIVGVGNSQSFYDIIWDTPYQSGTFIPWFNNRQAPVSIETALSTFSNEYSSWAQIGIETGQELGVPHNYAIYYTNDIMEFADIDKVNNVMSYVFPADVVGNWEGTEHNEPDTDALFETWFRPQTIKSKTWLTFNTYTLTEWRHSYHLFGENWNALYSPFAYINGIYSPTADKSMVFHFSECPAGKYIKAFNLMPYSFEVKDSTTTYISRFDTFDEYSHWFYDNLGALWYFGSGYQLSTDRNAYPDYGVQNHYFYKFVPEYTKFIEYYRTDELDNVELWEDRYKYSHDDTDLCDRSYEGTTTGDQQGTHEDTIPDADWRSYEGLYLGGDIPFLNIYESRISPAEILGVPQYDKQVNTSDTLKYGTVSAASLSFTLNKPVNECMTYSNQLLVLWYDFTNTDRYERMGFFRVDTIEALDENTTSLVAHDETYKLNKYVDDFLENYTQSTTLDRFYRDLLDYCDCFYDSHQPTIHNGSLSMTNMYHAVKTTGVQVAHYIAILVPGFIHTDIDGDIRLSQYELKDNTLTTADYSNLVYTAYNTDLLNKIKITSNNAVKGESDGSGENAYYLADDPLLSELQGAAYYHNLANNIYTYYSNIPAYRPATLDFFVLPRELQIGDIVKLKTPKNEEYKVIVMRMNISASGVQIQSFGTQKYPVEAESNSEFVNLINDMGEISGDVANLAQTQETMATAIANNADAIAANALDIESLSSTVGTHTTQISNLQTKTNGFGVSTNNNLIAITLNGTANNITNKTYVDNGDTETLNAAKAYADTKCFYYDYGTLTYKTSASATTSYDADVMWLGDIEHKWGIFVPQSTGTTHDMWKAINGHCYYYNGSSWYQAYDITYHYVG